jgi:hypothetical protein
MDKGAIRQGAALALVYALIRHLRARDSEMIFRKQNRAHCHLLRHAGQGPSVETCPPYRLLHP